MIRTACPCRPVMNITAIEAIAAEYVRAFRTATKMNTGYTDVSYNMTARIVHQLDNQVDVKATPFQLCHAWAGWGGVREGE